MKKEERNILIILLILAISLPIVLAYFGIIKPLAISETGCQIVRPVFGSVCCEEGPDYPVSLKVEHCYENPNCYRIEKSPEFYSYTHTCQGYKCVAQLPPDFTCPSGYDKIYGVILNGNAKCGHGWTPANGIECGTSIEFYDGDTITVLGACWSWAFGIAEPISFNGNIREFGKILWLYSSQYAKTDIKNTLGCRRQDLMSSKYGLLQPTISYDILYNTVEAVKEGVLPSAEEISNPYQIPDTVPYKSCYLFLDKWEPITTISLKYYDTNGDGIGDKPVYCDIYNRRLYEYTEITDYAGNCYDVPTKVFKEDIECCSNSDCYWKGVGYGCDATFHCSKENIHGCNSDIDCEAYGRSECVVTSDGRFFYNGWKCDFSKPQPPYFAGTCVSESKEVKCCDWYCSQLGQWCDPDKGCQAVQYPCPVGKCCLKGGVYKEQTCTEAGFPNYECCDEYDPRPYVGECKPSCVPMTCGDGICDPKKYENYKNCPEDCKPPDPCDFECYWWDINCKMNELICRVTTAIQQALMWIGGIVIILAIIYVALKVFMPKPIFILKR